jgi:hypothetical protein
MHIITSVKQVIDAMQWSPMATKNSEAESGAKILSLFNRSNKWGKTPKTINDRREKRNEYNRRNRQEVRQAKQRAEDKSVDPKVFLTNSVLLMTVSLWIRASGEAYARRELSKTGVRDAGINKIIKAANEYLATAPCDY